MGPSPRMTCPQNDVSRGVSCACMPTWDFSQRRSPSIREMYAFGTRSTRAARDVRRSKRSSGGVSRMRRVRSACNRSGSFCGMSGLIMIHRVSTIHGNAGSGK